MKELRIHRLSPEEKGKISEHRSNGIFFPSEIPWDRENLSPALADVRKPICQYLAGFDVPEMLNGINSIRNWNNGVDYISADFDRDWKLIAMRIGIFIPALAAYQVVYPSKREFLDMMEEICLLYREAYPEQSELLQREYTLMLQKYALHDFYL